MEIITKVKAETEDWGVLGVCVFKFCVAFSKKKKRSLKQSYTLNSVHFFPSTDHHPRAGSRRQLPDVLCGIPSVQRHLRHLQQSHQPLRGDGSPALRPHFLPRLPPHTSRGSSPKVWAQGPFLPRTTNLPSMSGFHSPGVSNFTPGWDPWSYSLKDRVLGQKEQWTWRKMPQRSQDTKAGMATVVTSVKWEW